MDAVKQSVGVAAPVVPTAQTGSAVLPFGQSDVRLLEGVLGERQQTNRTVTLRHGLTQLERSGALENFRIAAGLTTGERRGMVFSDSDVYKWLEAIAWETGREPSAELTTLAQDVITTVAAAQGADGYLNTYCQLTDPDWRWTDLEMGHELYCAGHLIQAAVAFARCTGEESLLGVARRFADLIDDEFRLGAQTGTDGHPEVEMALVELYRLTGERRYLELAETLTERRGRRGFPGGHFEPDYYQESTPVRETRTIVGHAVRALYLLSGVTDLSQETGDEELMASARAQWSDLVEAKLYLTGGIGSRHFGEAIGDPYELPPDRAYCETCAAIASIMWNWRMLLATGEARHADLIERTLYNGFLAGAGADGKSFFYVNPLQSRGAHRPRSSWDRVACCPPNIMRLLASLQQYLATHTEEGIQIHQYAGAVIETDGADAPGPGVRIQTRFPYGGRVDVEVTRSSAEPWTLSLRIPSWATGATIDGAPVTPGTYARLHRRWTAGDRVTAQFDMPARLTAADPRVDAVRGCVAIERGPLVYCVESSDLPEGVDLADLRMRADDPSLREGDAIGGLDGAPTVTFGARVAGRQGWGTGAYRGWDGVAGPEPSPAPDVTAVPYFLWGNREAGAAMRVWLPTDTSETR